MNTHIYPGEFYFKLTSNGNLVGEFTNRGTDYICTESAVRREAAAEGDVHGFAGDYLTSWVEADTGDHERAALKIELVPNRNGRPGPRRYLLKWQGEGVSFHGRAFVADGLLLGHYADGEG